MANPPKDQKPDKDEERENEVLRRMLNTPPQPHKPKGEKTDAKTQATEDFPK